MKLSGFPPALAGLLLLLGARPALAATPASARSAATPLEAVHVAGTPVTDAAGIGSLEGAPLFRSPVSVHLIDQAQLEDLQPRSLAEALRVDASVNDSYAPVGYYQNFSIRGFPLDLASGYRLNGLSIAGEQRFAFEGKQAVQILQGLAGVEAGVIAPGGLVNFISKRPAELRAITLGTDERGTRTAALDIGHWLSANLGVRFNAAWSDLASYVEHVDGRRNYYALALDWALGEHATLYLDSDYQSTAQRSVSGYQPLGGTELPADAHPEWLLGYQPWQQPTRIHTINHSARLAVELGAVWDLHLAAGHSRSVIDDNVAFAWGCYSVPACAEGRHPPNAFAPDGRYDIYDFRSPDDTRRNSEAKATLTGHLRHGALRHSVTFGVDALRRTVDQRPWVYEWVGSGNIHQDPPPVFAPSPLQAGPLQRQLSSWQRSVVAQDRIDVGTHWQALVGARRVRLQEQAWGDNGALARAGTLQATLPKAAILWLPNAAWTVYTSYAKGLSLGAEAPSWTSNGGSFLAPLTARQLEAGVKFRGRRGLEASLALFRIRRPFQFAHADASAAGFTFVQRGHQVHRGMELALHGDLGERLRVDGSVAWTHAVLTDTGVAAYEGHQTINVPRLRSVLALDYRLPGLPDLRLIGAWRHASGRRASLDGRVRTAGHDLFDAGFRYQSDFNGQSIVWRLYVSNLQNRFYWRDTGGNYGDYYLFPGPPRQARLSASWSF